jgi:formylmethanofuran dehydrogenase subunit E-like metal-binding protein
LISPKYSLIFLIFKFIHNETPCKNHDREILVSSSNFCKAAFKTFFRLNI